MQERKPERCPKCGSEIVEKNMPYGRIWECKNSKCPYWGGVPASEVRKQMDRDRELEH